MKKIFVSVGAAPEKIAFADREFEVQQLVDVIAVRDALRAIAAAAAEKDMLIHLNDWALAYTLSATIDALGANPKKHIKLFRLSPEDDGVSEKDDFSSIIVTGPSGTSLDEKRQATINAFAYDAAFFLAGGADVRMEFEMFRTRYGIEKCFPLPTTGGAAKKISDEIKLLEHHPWLGRRAYASIVDRVVSLLNENSESRSLALR